MKFHVDHRKPLVWQELIPIMQDGDPQRHVQRATLGKHIPLMAENILETVPVVVEAHTRSRFLLAVLLGENANSIRRLDIWSEMSLLSQWRAGDFLTAFAHRCEYRNDRVTKAG